MVINTQSNALKQRGVSSSLIYILLTTLLHTYQLLQVLQIYDLILIAKTYEFNLNVIKTLGIELFLLEKVG